jgi:hypothetical protein
VTVAHDGEQYFFISRGGLPVTFAVTFVGVAFVGQIQCPACGVWQAAEMHDLTDLEYAVGYVQTITQLRALNHAKTCTRKGDQHVRQ